jgi:Domain of unknown function (DUF4868)
MKELPEDVVAIARQGTVRIVFCEGGKAGYRVTRANVARDLQATFKDIAAGAATTMRQDNAPIAYEATERPPANRYPVLDRAADAAAAHLLRANLLTELDRAMHYAVLPLADLGRTRPLFYLIVAHHKQRIVLFGRALAPRRVPKKSRLITTIFKDNTLQRLEEELLLFDAEVDWIYWDRTFFVANAREFERIFLDREELSGKVSTNLGSLTAQVEIVGREDFQRQCAADLRMGVKLQRIIDRGEYKKWPPAQLRAYAQKYQPAMKWDGERMVFDPSPARRWDILKLLDEAWYSGELSRQHFEATSKVLADA